MYISPRTSKSTFLCNVKGSFFIVLTLCVISSPITPLPLVAAETNFPSLYIKETAKPSILSSQTYSGLLTSLRTLASKSLTSSSLKTSAKLNIGVG